MRKCATKNYLIWTHTFLTKSILFKIRVPWNLSNVELFTSIKLLKIEFGIGCEKRKFSLKEFVFQGDHLRVKQILQYCSDSRIISQLDTQSEVKSNLIVPTKSKLFHFLFPFTFDLKKATKTIERGL